MIPRPPRSVLPKRLYIPGLPRTLAERLLSLPRWVFFIAAMVIIPAAIVPVGALARYTTSSPTFCISCHGTGETPDRSPRSLVHPSFDQVTCVDCHAKPGQVVYDGYRGGFLAEPDRVAQNCLRCHNQMTQTNDQLNFKDNFLGIRITHQSHLARGATCTTCHSNIAHDLLVPQTNRPRMQACQTCHATTDACSKCHGDKVPTALPPVPAPAPVEETGDGRVFYLRVCSACHGGAGDALAQVNLNKQDVLDKLGEDVIFRAAEQGHGQMPAFGIRYGGTLSDDQIRSVIGYLFSQATGGMIDARALYNRVCIVCHGENGDKVAGVQFGSPAFWNMHTDTELISAISHGLNGMPPLSRADGGPLSDQDINSVIAMLKQKAGVTNATTANGPNGSALYQQNCVACHGTAGNQLPSANLTSKDFVGKLSDQELVAAISEGRGGMPAFSSAKGGKLADDEVKAIAQFVKTMAGLPASAAGSGDAIQGKTLFATNCAACHGANGSQLSSANLGSADYIKNYGVDALSKTISDGKGGMPAFGKSLSADQIANIVAFLESQQ